MHVSRHNIYALVELAYALGIEGTTRETLPLSSGSQQHLRNTTITGLRIIFATKQGSQMSNLLFGHLTDFVDRSCYRGRARVQPRMLCSPRLLLTFI